MVLAGALEPIVEEGDVRRLAKPGKAGNENEKIDLFL